MQGTIRGSLFTAVRFSAIHAMTLATSDVQRHMRAVEAQSDVGVRSAAVEDMMGESHDRRCVVDAQPVAVAASRTSQDGCGRALTVCMDELIVGIRC